MPIGSFRILAACLALCACAGTPSVATTVRLADPAATPETRALFANLSALATRATLFGHQNDLAYGYRWTNEPGRSDVKEVTGAYPAVYGWDLMDIFDRDDPDRYDPLRAERLRAYILEGFGRGGVITLCWHQPNPVNDSDAWDVKARAVSRLLPGADLHADFLAKLDIVAAFIDGLKTADGTRVPIVFRPFHEHTGSWFWWGRDHATIDEFKGLWRMTVTHLRDVRRLRNVLYAYSTDVFDSEAAYLERYPGDDVIDVLGFDDYHSIKSAETQAVFTNRLRMLVTMARARGKLAALTETGLEAIPDPDWWTSVLLKGMRADPVGRGIAWVLVWRNADHTREKRDHFYAPYPGQASAADFVRFYRDPTILFENELPALYRAGAVR